MRSFPREASFGDYRYEIAQVAKPHSIPLGYAQEPLWFWDFANVVTSMGMGEATRQCDELARPPRTAAYLDGCRAAANISATQRPKVPPKTQTSTRAHER
jgi:hypothetical protein